MKLLKYKIFNLYINKKRICLGLGFIIFLAGLFFFLTYKTYDMSMPTILLGIGLVFMIVSLIPIFYTNYI